MDKSHDDISKAKENSSARPAQSASGPRPHSGANPPQILGTSSAQSNSNNVAFKSDYIGQWAAKQEDPFAEQNRKAAAKKAAEEAARKKALPYIKIASIVAACLAVVAVIVVVIVVIVNQPKPEVPTISGGSSEDIADYTGILQDKYNESQNVDDINKVIDDTLNTENGREHEAQVRFAEMAFYFNNDYYQKVVDTGLKINPDSLQPDHRLRYYNYMYYSYAMLNDVDKSNEYLDLVYELSDELSEEHPSGGA